MPLQTLAAYQATSSVSYVVQDLLPTGGISILYGPPKCGKSTLARWVMSRVTNGLPFMGRETNLSSVVYYAMEEIDHQVIEQLHDFKCNPELIHLRFEPVKHDEFIPLMQKDVYDTKSSLLVVDPMMFVLGVSSISDYVEMYRSLQNILDCIRGGNAHIMFIHHGDKERNSILGSTALRAATDCNMQMRVAYGEARLLRSEQRYGVPIAQTEVALLKDGITFKSEGITYGF